MIRPGLIVGPGDESDRFTYWPVRLARGGDVLAPGDGKDPVQFIDARDLAQWTIRMVEARTLGVFNAMGPRGVAFDGANIWVANFSGNIGCPATSSARVFVGSRLVMTRRAPSSTIMGAKASEGRHPSFSPSARLATGTASRPAEFRSHASSRARPHLHCTRKAG